MVLNKNIINFAKKNVESLKLLVFVKDHDSTMIRAMMHRCSKMTMNAFNWFFSKFITEWKKYSFVIETMSSMLPFYTRIYVLHDKEIVRCKCCGGMLTTSVSGNQVSSACLHGEKEETNACENYINWRRVGEYCLDGKCKFKTCRNTEKNKYTASDLLNQRKWIYFKAMTIISVVLKKKYCEYVDLYDFKNVIDILSGFGLGVFTNPDWHHPHAIISGPEARKTKETTHYQFYNWFGMRNANHPWTPLFNKMMKKATMCSVASDPLPRFIGRLFGR